MSGRPQPLGVTLNIWSLPTLGGHSQSLVAPNFWSFLISARLVAPMVTQDAASSVLMSLVQRDQGNWDYLYM